MSNFLIIFKIPPHSLTKISQTYVYVFKKLILIKQFLYRFIKPITLSVFLNTYTFFIKSKLQNSYLNTNF